MSKKMSKPANPTSFPRKGLRAGKCKSCGVAIFVQAGKPKCCKACEATMTRTQE